MTPADLVRYVTIRTTDRRDEREMSRYHAARAEALLREVAKLSAGNYRAVVEGGE